MVTGAIGLLEQRRRRLAIVFFGTRMGTAHPAQAALELNTLVDFETSREEHASYYNAAPRACACPRDFPSSLWVDAPGPAPIPYPHI